ncbi:MAG: Bug family tripartite tricarboxylate transporter substrate binding protein [Bradyrhizobium sp.]|uniref:Bug family tripartite tricarboxylate transporter substrate binding protein n=1 Tax=Bradyrhizobium sp. TaxID=376 RepID=UPI003D10D0A8
MAQSEPFPSRPVRMVVPFAPGGGTDLLARQISERLAKIWGTPVIVENRPGGDSSIAASYVARRPGDGYTLLFSNSSLLVNHVLNKSMGFSFDDFRPMALIAKSPFVLTVPPDFPANNVKELASLSLKRKGSLNYSSTALSTMMATELLKLMTGMDALEVSYSSGAQGLLALMSGQTHLMLSTWLPIASSVTSGKVKAVAVSSEDRLGIAPRIPTFKEQGIDFTVQSWFGILVHKETPEPAFSAIASALKSVQNDATLKAVLEEQGMVASTADSAQFAEFIGQETKSWQRLLKSGGIKQ